MSLAPHHSLYDPSWSRAPQQEELATVHLPSPFLAPVFNSSDIRHVHEGTYDIFLEPGPHWHTPASVSPTSSEFTTSSSGFDSSVYDDSAAFIAPNPCSPFHANSIHAYSPVCLPPHPARALLPEPTSPTMHETFEVETGEEEVVRAVIHRFTDEEKRRLSISSAARPTFCCTVQGCGQWLLHRAQVKSHLSEHGYRFRKPFRCTCGAEFGRQVEAARHVEDKKLCEQCHRSGRKHRGGSICDRCYRYRAGKSIM